MVFFITCYEKMGLVFKILLSYSLILIANCQTEYPLLYDLDTTPIFTKCHCNITDIYVNGTCQELPLNLQPSALPFEIRIQDLECQENELLFEFAERGFEIAPDASVFLDGVQLRHLPDQYCAEDFLNEDNEFKGFVKTCLTKPEIPICCSNYQQVDVEGLSSIKCVESENETEFFHPPIFVDDRFQEWENLNFSKHAVSCPKDFELRKEVLSADAAKSFLRYLDNKVALNYLNEKNHPEIFFRGQFCLDVSKSTTEIEAYFCYQDHEKLCTDRSCVRKCCKEGEFFVPDIGCQAFDYLTDWLPPLFDQHSQLSNDTIVPNFTTIHGWPLCEDFRFLEEHESYFLQTSGELKVLAHRNSYSPSDYCVDASVDLDGVLSKFALLCFNEDITVESCYLQGLSQIVGLIVSCFFIIATLFVYISVPEILKRMPSKCVVSESFALLACFICIIALQTFTRQYKNSMGCVAIGLVFYYSTIASFFWLNVMCIDMYITINFRTSFRTPVTESGNSNNIWFMKYSAYAWGCPLLFLIAVCVVDNMKVGPENYQLIKPNIFEACAIPHTDLAASWAYMYGPMVVLVVVNMVLFSLISASLVKQKRELAKVLQTKESRKAGGGGDRDNKTPSHVRESFQLCMKLFLVMGITWVAEILSYIFDSVCYVWYLTNILNSLRGLFIFLIFVCKKDVIRKFKSTWRKRLGLRDSKGPSNKGTHKTPNNNSTSSDTSGRKTSVTSLQFLSTIVGRRKLSSVAPVNSVEMQKIVENNK